MPSVTQAVILVGGRGTRLGQITETLPKPMLPVGGRPFLDYQFWLLRQFGVTEVVLCVGYLAEVVEAHYGVAQPFGLRVSFSRELLPAGTGGALALARPQLDGMFLVLNGDTILDADLTSLATALTAESAAVGVLALRQVAETSRYGRVGLEGPRITSFAEKSTGGMGWVNGGVYCLRRSALDLLPLPPCSLEKDLFPRLAGERRLLGLPSNGYFIDIGLPETLARASAEVPEWMRTRSRGAPCP